MSLEISERMRKEWRAQNPTLELLRITDPLEFPWKILRCRKITVVLTRRSLHDTQTGWISAVWGREPANYQNFREPLQGKEDRLVMPIPLENGQWQDVLYSVKVLKEEVHD